MKLLRNIFLRLRVAGRHLLTGRAAHSKTTLKITVPQPLSAVMSVSGTQGSRLHRFDTPAPQTSDHRQAA